MNGLDKNGDQSLRAIPTDRDEPQEAVEAIESLCCDHLIWYGNVTGTREIILLRHPCGLWKPGKWMEARDAVGVILVKEKQNSAQHEFSASCKQRSKAKR
jgi:hypothetical protein